jgi:serine/threonine protein kinase
LIGQQVGNYKVLHQIGAGGMGEVYLAEHTTIGTRVAIKVLMAAISKDKDQVDRFFNEARAVNKVRHAGPVKIYDVGYHMDSAGVRQAYLVMEFLDGESLAGRIKRLGTLPGDQVADIGRQIAGVLDAVHTAGITHRDLKPDNIFLIPDHELPSGERVKVLDFGIAKLTGTMSGGGPQTKGTMGTPAYMAPEQWNNAASVDGRADTYSLGCVMFEMAVGQPPFPSQSIGEACNHHLNSRPPRASEMMRNVPVEFDNLVDRMLSKQSDQRPTIKEVSRAFDELRHSGATSRWTAAMVTGVQQTMGPDTPPPYNPSVHGSQPNLPPGSQPNINQGSQPNMGIHFGHQPGLQNPFMGSPSQQYPAQSGGSQPFIPSPQNTPPPGQHYTPQHHTPPPQHHTPQHHTPQHHTPQHTPQHAVQHTTPIPVHQTGPGQFTPQHPTPPPGTFPPQTAPKSKKGLIFALVGIAVVGGGVAVAVTQFGGGGKDPIGGGTGSDPGSGTAIAVGGDKPDAGTEKQIDAATKAPIDAAGPSLREQILAKNAFVNRHGVSVLSSQINSKEYELVMGTKPPGAIGDPTDPVHSVMQVEAVEFCTKIGARLPTSDEWTKAAKGAWGIAVGAVAGPLQEWTSTVQDELAVVRGGHEKMPQADLDKHARQKPPYFLQKDPGGPGVDRKSASSPTIGFRCVDAPPAPAKTGAADPIKSDTKPDAKPDAKPDTKVEAVTLPKAAGGSDRFARSWVAATNKNIGTATVNEVTLMQLTVSGDQVKGSMTEALTVADSKSMTGGGAAKKYMNYASVRGTLAGNTLTLQSQKTNGDALPTGMIYCNMSGKLTITDDAKKPGAYRLAGSMALVGASCSGESQNYEFKSR